MVSYIDSANISNCEVLKEITQEFTFIFGISILKILILLNIPKHGGTMNIAGI